MNLSNMFPASGDLAAQIKKPVATAVAKPTDNKAVGSSLADCMQTIKRPGEWAIKWPKLRKQGFKDYRPLLTIQEVIDYCNRCEETGLGGFDYETSGDKDHRIPPTDEDGNTVTGKALDSWTRDVNLDPWKAEVCAMSLSAACDEARAIFIDNPGANQFEPGLSRSEARKRLFDILEQYFFKLEINDDTGEAAPSHGPVAASSLIQQRRLIIAALEYAVDKGRINRNPGKKTRRPKSKPKTNNILTDEDMETLGIKGTKYRYYPAYMLTLTTACRRGEILGLDWQHVDIGIPWTTVDRYFPWGDIKKLPKWDTKALKILLEDHNITLGDGYLRLVYQMVDDNGTPFRDELKTDLSRRSLMITEEMVLLLIFWRLIQNTEKRKAAERGIEYNPDNLVFCTRKGTYIYPRNFTKMWSENLRSMGIDHKRFHDLRHTVATVMLEDGEAMNTVQEQLGHYDAGFTASRYGHVTAKMRNSAAVKLGERLEKVRNPEAEDAEDANSVKKEDTVIPFQEGRKLKSAACKIK